MTIVLIAALVSVVMGFVFALVETALGRVTRHRVVALAEEHGAHPAAAEEPGDRVVPPHLAGGGERRPRRRHRGRPANRPGRHRPVPRNLQGPRTVRLEEGGHQWLTAASQ